MLFEAISSTGKRLSRGIAWLVVLVCMTACRPANPEHGPPYYTEFPEGASYMNLRWPAVQNETPAVHFRIPKEDMDISRLRGDMPGEVGAVFLDIRIPRELAKNLYERIPNHGEFKPRPGVPFVREAELLQIPNDAHMRTRRFEQWSFGCGESRWCVQDGGSGSLTRYSEVYCPTPAPPPPRLDGVNSGKDWSRETRIPEGCYALRASAYLSNSVTTDQGEEGIDISCSVDMCDMSLQVNGRRVRVSLRTSQLEYVPELAAIVRSQVRQYIIP